MTDPRQICPIPPDAQIGDIVVFRDGQRRKIECIMNGDGEYWVEGMLPGGVHKSGNNWYHKDEKESEPDWDCIAFEYAAVRKPNLHSTAKPKRTQAQRDGAWLRKFVRKCYMPTHETKRMLAIADRLEKQQ